MYTLDFQVAHSCSVGSLLHERTQDIAVILCAQANLRLLSEEELKPQQARFSLEITALYRVQ